MSTHANHNVKYGGRGLSGLKNLGNTCFLNSTMQCLSHTYELNDILDNTNTHKRIERLKEDSTDKDKYMIFDEWNNLRNVMWSQNCKISPNRFIHAIQSIATKKGWEVFTGYSQNDLQEFIMFFMDCLHSSLARPVRMKITGTPQNNTDIIAKKSYEMISNLYEKEYSEIIKIFYGIHVTVTKKMSSGDSGTDNGKILAVTPEPFFMLNLPIPVVNRECTLYDCIDEYTKKETLTGENAWKDDNNEKHDVTRQIQFFSLPDVLIIHLKRFLVSGVSMRKNNAWVRAQEHINLSKYVSGYSKNTYNYELYGVSHHFGNLMGGHYIADVKNADGNWYRFNDLQVSKIDNTSKGYNVGQSASCLFYRKLHN